MLHQGMVTFPVIVFLDQLLPAETLVLLTSGDHALAPHAALSLHASELRAAVLSVDDFIHQVLVLLLNGTLKLLGVFIVRNFADGSQLGRRLHDLGDFDQSQIIRESLALAEDVEVKMSVLDNQVFALVTLV